MSASPSSRAAVLGSHFSSWRRGRYRRPFYYPPQFDEYMPMDEESTVRVISPTTMSTDLHQLNSDQLLHVCSASEYHRPASAYPTRHRCMREVELAALRTSETKQACRCCEAYRRMIANVAAPKREAGVRYEVAEHTGDIEFCDETWITTVTQRVVFRNITQSQAGEVFESADPRNWSRFGAEFFEETCAVDSDFNRLKSEEFIGCTWQDGELRAGNRWVKDGEGLSFEHVFWNWGSEIQGGAQNILRISKFEAKDNSFSYNYNLHYCLRARFLATWERGGLNVDEGFFRGTWENDVLTLCAEKRIRYTDQPNSPPRFSMLLNLLAPALTSMFLKQLALDGVRRVLDRLPTEELANAR